MKRVAAVIVATLVSVFCSFSVYAEDAKSIEIALCCDGGVTGRSFDVRVISDEIDKITGGEFTLSYDSSVLDFKKVSSDTFEVKTKVYSDALKIVFAVDDAGHIGDELFAVQFKAKSKAVTDIKLANSYVVDRNLSVVPIVGDCEIFVDTKQPQKAEKSDDKTKDVTACCDFATADSQSIKIDDNDTGGLAKYIVAGAVVVAAVGFNIWLVLRKRCPGK